MGVESLLTYAARKFRHGQTKALAIFSCTQQTGQCQSKQVFQ